TTSRQRSNLQPRALSVITGMASGGRSKLKSDPDGPDIFQLERSLLSDQLSLVPRLVGLRCVKNCHDLLLMKGVVRVLPRQESRRDATRSGHLLIEGIANGLYKAEVIHRRSWQSLEAVELATLEWVNWFNLRRLLEPISNIPPAEAEAAYYQQTRELAMAA
ncbi:IS3 family transposase, partial [Stenotrophomonas maltophilia]